MDKEKQFLASLDVGQTYSQDLVDPDGNLILEAGETVTPELFDDLHRLGISQLFLAVPNDLSPYSKENLNDIQLLFDDAPAIVEDVGKALREGGEVNVEAVDHAIDKCLAAVDSDPCAVLSSAMVETDKSLESGNAQKSRSIRMASIAITMAGELGLDQEQQSQVGRAALLSDVGMTRSLQELDAIERDTSEYDQALGEYQTHPLLSAEALRHNYAGITQLELIAISQSHEQLDGLGFPRGLTDRLIHPYGKILNTVEVFLTLTDPNLQQGQLIPADALAYMVLHSLYGSLDRECVKALVTAAAVYPVGTEVELDDARSGRVLRSMGSNYLDPVIEIDGSHEILDLGNASSKIQAPVEMHNLHRLLKSDMHQQLWLRTT